MDQLANTVINKMYSEMERLRAANGHAQNTYNAMRNIHLLSELWLEAYPDQTPKKEHTTTQPNVSITTHDPLQPKPSTDQAGTGKDDFSIFDF